MCSLHSVLNTNFMRKLTINPSLFSSSHSVITKPNQLIFLSLSRNNYNLNININLNHKPTIKNLSGISPDTPQEFSDPSLQVPEIPNTNPDYNPSWIPKEIPEIVKEPEIIYPVLPEIDTDPDPKSSLLDPGPGEDPVFPGMPPPPDPMIPKEVPLPGPPPTDPPDDAPAEVVPHIPPEFLPPEAPLRE